MRSDRVRLALYDIRDCIFAAREFVKDLSYDAFKDSRLHIFAVTRALEIISEASRRLPEVLRARRPHLPWQEIRDAGNLYRHCYDNVVEAIVWKLVQEDLTPRRAAVVAEIESIDAGR
jgi:uncharacterized protein with HEPN domain